MDNLAFHTDDHLKDEMVLANLSVQAADLIVALDRIKKGKPSKPREETLINKICTETFAYIKTKEYNPKTSNSLTERAIESNLWPEKTSYDNRTKQLGKTLRSACFGDKLSEEDITFTINLFEQISNELLTLTSDTGNI